MPMDVVGIITKVSRAIGQRALRKWLLAAEVVEGKYVVYISNRGESPFVDVLLSLRVQNRNNSPTTLYAERMTVRPSGGVEVSFPLPKLSHFGEVIPLGTEGNRIEIGASGTTEVTFNSRKYFRDLPEGYLKELPLDVKIRIAETFGNHREVIGQAECVQILRQ